MIIPIGTRMSVKLADGRMYTGVVTSSDSEHVELDGGVNEAEADAVQRVNQRIREALEAINAIP